MANLFELNAKIADFNLEINDDGEITNADELEALEMERDEKIENIALWILNLRADAKMYKEQKEAFYAKQKQAENKEKWLKVYLQRSLNGQKFKANDGKVEVSYRKSDRVQYASLDYIEDKYIKHIEEFKPDLVAIKKALKAGESVVGCWLVSEDHIQVR